MKRDRREKTSLRPRSRHGHCRSMVVAGSRPVSRPQPRWRHSLRFPERPGPFAGWRENRFASHREKCRPPRQTTRPGRYRRRCGCRAVEPPAPAGRWKYGDRWPAKQPSSPSRPPAAANAGASAAGCSRYAAVHAKDPPGCDGVRSPSWLPVRLARHAAGSCNRWPKSAPAPAGVSPYRLWMRPPSIPAPVPYWVRSEEWRRCPAGMPYWK